MKRLVAAALAVLVAWVGSACDEDKKKAELLAKTGAASATSAAPATASAVAPTPIEPTAEAKASKKDVMCPPGPELNLSDPDVEAQVRLKLSKPKDPLKMSDLANVRSLDLTKKKELSELDPCLFPKMTGLRHLYLGPGHYRDLSPISNLVHLETLRASISEVEDLKPLEKLVMLDILDLGRTHVRDLSVLANLTNLTELSLDNTQVADLAPLAKTKKLEKLNLKNTNVTDVSPLKGLEKLKFLYVAGTAITNLDAIEPLKNHGMRVMTN